MLSRPSSSAAALVSPRAPHLLATYAPIPKLPRIPSVEEMLTIAPPPALRIEGTTARVPRYVPVRLMSITWRQAAISVSAITPKRTMPALLISTETGPKASSAAATVVARDVEAGENRVNTKFVGERSSLLFEYVRDHNVRALGHEAARVAGTHSTGTTRDDHCPIAKTFYS